MRISALERMQQRVLELEIELCEAAERARYFGKAAAATATLSKSTEQDRLIANLLESISTLGFRRVIYFNQIENGSILNRLLDLCPRLLRASVPVLLLQKPDLDAARIRGVKIGGAGDLSSPVPDVRGWYVFAPIRGDDARTFIYADDHAEARSDDLFSELFSILTGVAAAALRAADTYERLRRLARSDPLTGLFNRRAFYETLGELLAGCSARGTQCAAVIVDVDDLKRVNDAAGHQAGDATLANVARVLLAAARPADLVARLAGDEFVVTVAECDDGIARSLVRRLSRDLRAGSLRCSLGAALSHPTDVPETLLARADEALYAVKKAGKNGFAFRGENALREGLG